MLVVLFAAFVIHLFKMGLLHRLSLCHYSHVYQCSHLRLSFICGVILFLIINLFWFFLFMSLSWFVVTFMILFGLLDLFSCHLSVFSCLFMFCFFSHHILTCVFFLSWTMSFSCIPCVCCHSHVNIPPMLPCIQKLVNNIVDLDKVEICGILYFILFQPANIRRFIR